MWDAAVIKINHSCKWDNTDEDLGGENFEIHNLSKWRLLAAAEVKIYSQRNFEQQCSLMPGETALCHIRSWYRRQLENQDP